MLVSCLLNPNVYKESILYSLDLFIKIIIPSIVPIYVLASLLRNSMLFSKITYPIAKYFINFPSINEYSIFLLGIICGNPTVTTIIKDALDEEEISPSSANKLIRFTNHMSPLFILNIAILANNKNLGYAIIISTILSSCIIAKFSYINNSKGKLNYIVKRNKSFFEILDVIPSFLFNILFLIISVSFLKTFLHQINIFEYNIINYFSDFLEITIGSTSIISYSKSLLFISVFLVVLFSTTGLCILLQTINIIKKTKISIYDFLVDRLVHLLLSICFILFFYFINFF